jgi:hypothetical protein
MRLADRLAQCRVPFVVQSSKSGEITHLNGAAEAAPLIATCPIRYVLSDELTRLCTALAYSKGARRLACADLLRMPATQVWVEWCEVPWQSELTRYGIHPGDLRSVGAGRRGALIRAARDGRSGTIRTFWTVGDDDTDLLASSMEAYFDLDATGDDGPAPPDGEERNCLCVSDTGSEEADILRHHFRFRFERSWYDYYSRAAIPQTTERVVAFHALGTIAPDIPMLLAFLLLLSTRTGLPRRPSSLERLNRARARAGKAPLLEHIEVSSPLAQQSDPPAGGLCPSWRRAPRLHHVRGHLMRRGSQLFWRVPHLRGHARFGAVQSRTVTWTIDRPS